MIGIEERQLGRVAVEERWRGRSRLERRALGTLHGSGFALRTAASPRGHLLLATFDDRHPTTAASVGWRRPGGRLKVLRAAFGRVSSPFTVAVALAADGRGFLATPGPRRRIRIRAVSATGALGHPHDARLPVDGPMVSAALARNARGDGVLVAKVGGRDERLRVLAWRLDAQGRPGRTVEVRGPGERAESREGVAATLDARGRARVAWTTDRLRVLRLP